MEMQYDMSLKLSSKGIGIAKCENMAEGLVLKEFT